MSLAPVTIKNQVYATMTKEQFQSYLELKAFQAASYQTVSTATTQAPDTFVSPWTFDGPSAPARPRHKTAKEVVAHTVRVIEEFGWQQGSIGNVRDGFCIVGAMEYAFRGTGYYGSEGLHREAYKLIQGVIDNRRNNSRLWINRKLDRHHVYSTGIPSWNDGAHGRVDKDMVLSVLREAAA